MNLKWNLPALALLAISALASPMIIATDLKGDDYLAIQQLYARYNTAIDHGDGEAWARTFTPDGVFAGNFKGHDALVGFVNNWRANPAMNGALRRHFSADLVITPTAEGATASVSTLLVDLSTKPVSIASFVTYADVLAKTGDGWRFKSRAVKAEGPPPAAATPAPAAK